MSKFIEEMNAAIRQQQSLGNSTIKVELTENGLHITNVPYADMYNLAGKTPYIAVVDGTEPAQVSQPVLVEISEYGEGQENDCPTCGAEFGQSCSSENGVEHGRRIHEARLAQHKPEVSPPVAETYVINKGGSGEFIAIDWKDKEGSYVGLLYSLPPDYEALKDEIARLQHEVVNRNRRALDGDLAMQVRDAVLAENEALKWKYEGALESIRDHAKLGRVLLAENEALKLRVAGFEKLAEDHAQSAESYAEQAKKYSDQCGDLMAVNESLKRRLDVWMHWKRK